MSSRARCGGWMHWCWRRGGRAAAPTTRWHELLLGADRAVRAWRAFSMTRSNCGARGASDAQGRPARRVAGLFRAGSCSTVWKTGCCPGSRRARARASCDASGLQEVLVGVARLGTAFNVSIDGCRPHFETPAGTRRRIQYGLEGPPTCWRVPLQEVLGLREGPMLADGRLPLLLHLLSPAGRPLQVTTDLAGFLGGCLRRGQEGDARSLPQALLAG